MMEKLPMCRICLAQNVRMFLVVNTNLHELYEKLTDVPFVTEDSRPILACFICCAKLKQCYRLLKQCLEAEELFAQKMNEGYEPNPLVYQGHFEFYSGFIKSPTEYISIVDIVKKKSIAVKDEIPAVFEGLDDVIEPNEEHQSDELEPENLDNCCLDVVDIPPQHSESVSEDDVPLVEFNTEVENVQEVSKKKQRTREKKKQERENLDNTCLDVADVQPHDSEPRLDDDVPLMEFQIELAEEQEVSETKRRTRKVERATVAEKTKLDTRRTKQEVAEQTKKGKSNSIIIRATRKRKTKPVTYFKEPYKCDQRSFNGVKKNKHHTQIGQKLKCDVCQRSFSRKGLLINHIRIHTGEKPYKCDVCQRSFREKGCLTKHNRLHTGEKSYMCDVCQRSFRGKDTLTKHIRIHTGEKPYTCDVCQRSFREKGNLTKHIRIHTCVKPYKCDICQQRFSEKGNLTKHILLHTEKKKKKREIVYSAQTRRTLPEKIRNTH